MKTLVAAIAAVALCGVMYAQDEKNAFDKLKDAMGQKNASTIKTLEPAAYKFAESTINAPKPNDPEEAKTWAANVEAGKEMATYTEYALASTAEQPGTDPATAAALCEMLLAQNPKSQYIDEVFANAYLIALGKTGNKAKQMEGMASIAKGHPDNIAANIALLEGGRGSLVNAEHLTAAAKRPRPESVPEADWEKVKNEALANGYYYAGFINGQKQNWRDCDNNLRAAVPLISGERLEAAYFTIGICEFQFGKLTLDRTKMESGQQFMQKAAAMKGPYQGQAYQQAAAMRQALGGR
ncbi:MAG TPA: hypothetical protein VMB85_01640 [Bryobacteraceae bacterium]|nr:hypothetical protein [Bryobacteraceae bacterium]